MHHPLVARIPATFRSADERRRAHARRGQAMRRPLKLALAGTAAGVGLLLLTTGVAGAQTSPDINSVDQAVKSTAVSLNLLWVIIGAVLVIFMQAGFALVETGFCRAKHAAHVVSTNFAIFGLGFVGVLLRRLPVRLLAASASPRWAWTEPLQAPAGGLIGSGNWVFLWGKGGWACPASAPHARAAAPSSSTWWRSWTPRPPSRPGAMAERWKWKSFVMWGLFCGAIYYPLFAAWTWGGGWLSKLGGSTMSLGVGYVDFAGSGVVHAVGGVAALAGAIVLGPRIGKFGKDGKPRALPGHHIPMAMLGTFILLFGWFGFNAASTLRRDRRPVRHRGHQHRDRGGLRRHRRRCSGS